MMKCSRPITIEDIEEFEYKRYEFLRIKNLFLDRIHGIIEIILEQFNIDYDCFSWSFKQTPEPWNIWCDLPDSALEVDRHIDYFIFIDDDIIDALKAGMHDFAESFPSKFLSMTDLEVKDYIIDSINIENSLIDEYRAFTT